MTADTTRSPGRFAEFVRRRREDLGMTMVEMSERAGIPQNYISQIESGRILFPRRYLPNFARALAVSELDLLRAGGYAADDASETSNAEPDPAELALLMRWRDLAPEDREMVAKLVELQAELLKERRRAEESSR